MLLCFFLILDPFYQNIVINDSSHRISIYEFPSFVKNSKEIIQYEFQVHLTSNIMYILFDFSSMCRMLKEWLHLKLTQLLKEMQDEIVSKTSVHV